MENVSVRIEASAAPSRRGIHAWDRFHDGGVSALVTLLACGATVLLVLTAGSTIDAVAAAPADAAVYLAIALGLGLVNVEVYGRGTVSVGAIGLLAIGMALGAGPAAYAAVLVAFAAWLRLGGRPQRAIFNAGALALAAAAAAEIPALVAGGSDSVVLRSVAGLAAATVFWLLNIGLLTLVMAFSERLPPVAVWHERFRWLTPYYLAYGPLAVASVLAGQRVGVLGLVAFTLPPAVLLHSMRQYLSRTRESVEQIRAVNERLATANAQLAARNDDLRELLEFAGGLSQHAHDRAELVAYTQRWLSRVTGGDARIRIGPGSGGVALRASGVQVGSLSLVDDDEERWGRLRDAVLPHLATAIQNVVSVEEARRTHLATIAALSRSMEAKDYYTGGHTERVAALSVELGKRLGLDGEELDALMIGALLHDVGKIGIPERILHKPGPLDEDEWEVMREHPVISDYILSEVELPPIVRQVARWSHERIDGQGYPDRLAGEAIPLAARIVLVADAFDAITTDRPYRPARDARSALAELRANTGSQFCPEVVAALEQLIAERAPAPAAAPPLRAVS
jgi:HD-GYP domain-containing protein (c-di-GMP phosphodiesterase class II)